MFLFFLFRFFKTLPSAARARSSYKKYSLVGLVCDPNWAFSSAAGLGGREGGGRILRAMDCDVAFPSLVPEYVASLVLTRVAACSAVGRRKSWNLQSI